MSMKKLRVYDRIPNVETLGPGKRYGLWVQGCSLKCPGCISEESRSMEGGTLIEIGALAWEIILSGSDGITISGGEPFLQAAELAELLEEVHRMSDMGVIVYSGLLYEDLKQREDCRRLLDQIDLLIDGPYIRELDDGLSLRGSANQRAILITDRYQDFAAKIGTEEREVQTFRYGDKKVQVGIPGHSKTGTVDTRASK